VRILGYISGTPRDGPRARVWVGDLVPIDVTSPVSEDTHSLVTVTQRQL